MMLGDTLFLKSLRAHSPDGRSWVQYKPPAKGKMFAVMFLDVKGDAPLNTNRLLNEMGWVFDPDKAHKLAEAAEKAEARDAD